MSPALGNTSRFRARRSRSGFTLLEVLVATAVTLLMMVALAKIFSDIGRSMKQGRAALELNGRLRDVTYRIQTSLNNATASPNSAPGTVSGRGYLEIYDGPTTDFSSQLMANSELINRFGDVDDILMFTARAGDIWFTGKVPSFILEGRAPSNADTNPANGRADDFENLISVASQHAEIAIWMQPVVAGESSDGSIQNPQRDSSYLVANPAFYQDSGVNPDGTIGDGLPDSWRLHYRVNIIRPDLNLPAGYLPHNINQRLFVAESQTYVLNGSSTRLPTPICDMYRVHGVCDLSMRRLFDGDRNTPDRVAANSLEDLENPANRFAHVQVPIPGTSSTTMPLMALTSLNGAGFLHPAYSLFGERTGEDILANDVLAFDIKVYDPGVPILASWGSDGGPGVNDVDDDGNMAIDLRDDDPRFASDPALVPVQSLETGWAGSDDLVLSPNDPGYGVLLEQIYSSPLNTSYRDYMVGTGEYVDIAWAHKLRAHGLVPRQTMNLWSPFSGMEFSNFAPGGPNYTTGLLKSGRVVLQNGNLVVFQPSYDTWTPGFERDGILQANRNNLVGTVRINGNPNLYGNGSNELNTAQPPWRQNNVDPAYDGLDNDGVSGADNQSEFETSAPFDVPLRGMKISVRMENPGAREVRELPVSVEFVTR